VFWLKTFVLPFQNKIIYNFWLQEIVGQKVFPPHLLMLLLDPGSRMDKNQDPGSAIA
jgi:hypothetical protein